MLDIVKDRSDIIQLFNSLNSEKKPLFGKMTPQHMIEHLVLHMTWSNGKNPQICLYSTRDAEKIKSILVYSDKEMIPGEKNPMFSTEPHNLICSSMEEAIEDLQIELGDFDTYYDENEYGKQTDPRLGELGYKEWVAFHSKHFRHHLRQFDLI